MNSNNESARRYLLAGYILFVVSLFLDFFMDVFDLEDGWQTILLSIEIGILILGTYGFVSIWRLLGQKEELHRKLEHHVKANDKTRKQFQDYVMEQFTNWNFTESEKEVGIFLLKGLTFKEISEIRQVSEKTIRNQSTSIYSKSSLSGKHDLAAYFLEEMFSRIN